MKTRLLAFALLLCTTFTTEAQYVTIPDANFVTWLQTNYPNCMQGNQMDTTCNGVVNTYTVNVSNKGLNDISGIQYFDSLKSLNCSFNSLTTLPSLPIYLETLKCNDNQIDSLPLLPDGLYALNCYYNNLMALPQIPSQLAILNCFHNSISALPILPSSLSELNCRNNLLTSIPPLTNSLQNLQYSNNFVTNFGPYPDSVEFIACSNNGISSIGSLPYNLKQLWADNNLLDSLPSLPNNLQSLLCNNNHITILPGLPTPLYQLDCRNNLIGAMPTLPNGLRQLDCGNNLLTQIPTLPNSLLHLSCDGNKHTQLLNIPSITKYVVCGGDSLQSIPAIPDTLDMFNCSNSPLLNCLPKLGVINVLDFSNTGITCLPNYGTVSYSSPQPLISFPICDANNTNSCEVLTNISGRTYFDVNSNCILDNAEIGQTNIKYEILQNGQLIHQMYSSGEGLFSFDVAIPGNYETHIDTTNLPFIVSCPANGVLYDTLTLTDSIHLNRNFALRCKTGFDLAAHSISTAGIFRPANNTTVNIHAGDLANFYNANCAFGVAGTVTITINGPATYISPANGANAPSNVAGNVLTYTVVDFGTADALHDFNIVVQTDTFAQMGQQVCFTVRVTPTASDRDTTNNTLTHCFPIVNSYDPNDKTAYPAGDIDTAQEWLTYTVRFQNTGNAEAQHIYIMDTLESDLDVSTFQLLAYSHQPNVQIKENVVRFNFPNINLPDSFSNEPGSHGYVQYKVKLKENLPIGTTIENTAFIYFDFNPPVVTNTATNTIAEIEDTTIIGIKPIAKAFDINIYPNPANNQVTIMAGQAGNTIYMYTAQGKLVATQNMGGTAETLNIAELPGGIYYIEVAGKAGTARKKLVKF